MSASKQSVNDCSAGSGGSLRLHYVHEEAQSSFVELVTCLPALVEAYESTDTLGATARRYTFVTNSEHEVASAPAEAPGHVEAVSAAEAPSSSTPQEAAESEEHRAAGGGAPASQPTPLAGEAEWLRRRFGSAVCIDESATPHEALEFTIALHPNDPDWEPGRELHLQGSAAAGYPALGSFRLAPGPGLPEQARAWWPYPALKLVLKSTPDTSKHGNFDAWLTSVLLHHVDSKSHALCLLP